MKHLLHQLQLHLKSWNDQNLMIISMAWIMKRTILILFQKNCRAKSETFLKTLSFRISCITWGLKILCTTNIQSNLWNYVVLNTSMEYLKDASPKKKDMTSGSWKICLVYQMRDFVKSKEEDWLVLQLESARPSTNRNMQIHFTKSWKDVLLLRSIRTLKI